MKSHFLTDYDYEIFLLIFIVYYGLFLDITLDFITLFLCAIFSNHYHIILGYTGPAYPPGSIPQGGYGPPSGPQPGQPGTVVKKCSLVSVGLCFEVELLNFALLPFFFFFLFFP